jgi:molecular chaperone HtpG
VLLLTDPIDEYLMSHLHEYKGKKFKAADKGDATPAQSEEEKKKAEEFKPLLEAIKGKLGEVKEVRLSHRLKESAAVLVADEFAPSAHMERLLKRMGQPMESGGFKRTLELNPDHPVVKKLAELQKADPNDPKIEAYARLLLDQATIAEGSPINDPAGFARRINALIA